MRFFTLSSRKGEPSLLTPDHKTEESDAYHGVNYTKVSEDSFVRIGRDNMGDCSECGNDKNIDLGMRDVSILCLLCYSGTAIAGQVLLVGKFRG